MKRIVLWFGYIVIGTILYMLEVTVISNLKLQFQYLPAVVISIVGTIVILLYLFYLKDCEKQNSVMQNVIFLVLTIIVTLVVFFKVPTVLNLALYLLAEELYTFSSSILKKR